MKKVATIKAPKNASKAKKNLGKALNKLVKVAAPKVEALKPTVAAPKASKAATKKDERSYGRDKETIAAIVKEAGKGIPNPYREGSSYHTVLAAISSFGLGKEVAEKNLIARFVKIADAEYLKAFKSKKPRNKETGKTWESRVIQNATVLCRVKDYGLPICQAGMKLTYSTVDGSKVFKLNKA